MEQTDPRGPLRKIVAVGEIEYGHKPVTLSCGHIRNFNAYYSYHVGEDARCLACLDPEKTNPKRIPV